MSGPPSQAGRFKPRKPAKKIRVGASTPAAAAAAAAEPAPAASARSSSRSSSSPGRGRGGRGRGRGGRAPTPHGAVFFTGNAPPTVAAKKNSSTTTSLSSTTSRGTKGTQSKAKNVIKKETTEEIVVGQLDVGIGGSELVEPHQEEETEKKAIRREKSEESETTRKTSKFEPLVDTYDSDSSEEMYTAESQANVTLPPTELPFPVASLPVGIGGGHERPIMYSCQEPQESRREQNEPILVELQKDDPLVSPFVDWKDAKLRQEERDSLFLIQFPTRIPAIQSTGVPIPDPIKSEEPSLTPDNAQSMPMDVTTPSTNTNNFDNALSRAPAGRLGKFVVYKSGKTELVMGGVNGASEVCVKVMVKHDHFI